MKYKIISMTVFSMLCSHSFAASNAPRAVEKSDACLTYDCAMMENIKYKLKQSGSEYAASYTELLKKANAALGHKVYSVTDKTLVPASGDKHDYYSFGPYWWPNPATVSKLPYIRKDGEINPEAKTEATDSKRLVKFTDDVRALSLAWFYSGEVKYANKAQQMLHTWFLNKSTRMNPNLNYAQAIPGVVNGRGIGIIDTRALIDVADSIVLLKASGSIPVADYKAYQQWYSEYLKWLLTSKNGIEESNWHNNHGAWFDAQVTAFSLFTGDLAQAEEQVKIFTLRRVAGQVNNKGELSAELERSRSFHYTNFTLAAYAKMGRYGERIGEDVWGFKLDGHSTKNAFLFLNQQAGESKDKWAYKEIRYKPQEAVGPVLSAARAYGDSIFTEKAQKLTKEYKTDINILIPGSILVR
ncbi:alginate lyase family protein [Dryocola clanedunensis]|uniref:alginate lyase family protein n=1 Tax=Cedecea sulfonylureivorans TaxID=3051154 RepID=UPI001F275D94|nr:alginate lyase family protein [Cedecea sulfonylureivorans]